MDTDPPVPPSSPPRPPADASPSSSPLVEPRSLALAPTSSSPPLFSSDDAADAADVSNYLSPRYKRKRAGTWWDAPPPLPSAARPPTSKRARFTRNYDSGVHMMSDASESPADQGAGEATAPAPAAQHGVDRKSLQRETGFYRSLQHGLDAHTQYFDFSERGLEDGEIKQIGLLAQMIRPVPGTGNDTEVPAPGQYRAMSPDLHLDLSQNELEHLTPSLFHLAHIKSLNLSWNFIEELPPQVAELRDMTALNLSTNYLTTLPFDMLKLFPGSGHLDCEQFHCETNWRMESPLDLTSDLRAFVAEAARRTSEGAEDALWTWEAYSQLDLFEFVQMSLGGVEEAYAPYHHLVHAWAVRYIEARFHPQLQSHHPADTRMRFLARSPVSYYNQVGTLLDGCPDYTDYAFLGRGCMVDLQHGTYNVPDAWFEPAARRPTRSLMAQCLDVALHELGPDETRFRLSGEGADWDIPLVADKLIEHSKLNLKRVFSTHRTCNICHKEYVVDAAVWVEWWAHAFDFAWPFLVRVCSWACVPDGFAKKPEKIVPSRTVV